VASIPVDIGDLPWDNGDELQSLALELYDTAKVKHSREKRTTPAIFIQITLILIGKVDYCSY